MGDRLSSCMTSFLSAPRPSTLSGMFRAAAAAVGMAEKTEFVVPPESYDKSWSSDLISEKSPFAQFGPRAGWLYQMAVAVPLSWWTEHTGRTAEELLALSEHSEWKKPLQMAFGDAVLREGDASFARAMLKTMKKGGVWPSSAGRSLDSFALAAMLNGEERERFRESIVSPDTLADLLEDIRRRQELEYRMSPPLADKMLEVLKSRLLRARNRDYMLFSVIDELAMVLPPEFLEKARQILADLPEDSPNREISDRFSVVARQRITLGAYFS